MACYSIEPRYRIFVKRYGFLTFPKNMGKNNGKNISKNLSSKYSHKLLDYAKQYAAGALKTASKKQQNQLVISRTSPKNTPDTVTNEKYRKKCFKRKCKTIAAIEIINRNTYQSKLKYKDKTNI